MRAYWVPGDINEGSVGTRRYQGDIWEAGSTGHELGKESLALKGWGNRMFDRLEKGGMEHIGKWVTVI